MHVSFVTAEVAPYSGSSPSAEVAGALPKGLRAHDTSVTVISPLYRSIDPAQHALARRLSKVEVEVGGETLAFEMYTGRNVSGVQLIFLGHEDVFAEVDSFFEGAPEAVARRLAAFARAAAKTIADHDEPFDVVHAQGSLGAAVVPLVSVPTVLSVHGTDAPTFAPGLASILGDSAIQVGGLCSPLHAGIAAASRVTSASRSHADELMKRHDISEERMTAIPRGIDASVWNPLTDAHLPSRFDPVDLSGKAKSKSDLQRDLDLPVRDDLPLIGVDAVDDTSGPALFTKVASQLLRNDVQVVVVFGADADGALVATFEELWDRWPDRIAVRTGASDELRHQLYGGADLMIVAPEHAPAGGGDKRAHRYGALPIVHRTGALADTVVDCDAKLETGTGFAFDGHDADALLGTVQRAIAGYGLDGFADLRARVMRIDHSWERSARMLATLYVDLITPPQIDAA